MANEIERLNRIRLEEDLSVAVLADRIRAADPTGTGIERSALHRLLFERGRVPRDRTLHKIRRFLEVAAAEKQRRRKRQATAA